jgi:transcription initiation factor IIE alpha subunit
MRLEYLARVVARAFYEDDTQIVMDALVREKYLEESADGMGAHLTLQLKQVRKIIQELKDDGLVCDEDVDGVKFYYIDHQHFYDVVNYKVFLIRTELRKRERAAVQNQRFQCKGCGKEYSSLDMQSNLNEHMKHVCNWCGAVESLNPVDNKADLEEAKDLQEKFDMQMRRSEGQGNWLIHDGIDNLLGKCNFLKTMLCKLALHPWINCFAVALF